jgi:predicted lipoprotein
MKAVIESLTTILQTLKDRKAEALRNRPDPQCSPYLFEYWSGRVNEIDALIKMIEGE